MWETERWFLVRDDGWRSAVVRSHKITQRVVLRDPSGAIARVRQMGDTGFLTIKGAKIPGQPSIPEFEWVIPVEQVEAMKAVLGGGGIEKTRHEVLWDGRLWEVDVFEGANQGLLKAEIEFKFSSPPLAIDALSIPLPPWVGAEVTHDRRYSNASLEQHPWPTWGA